jgi:hypothetical protein
MALCKEKKESIKSTTIWLYLFGKLLLHKKLISKKDHDSYIKHLHNMESCTNQEETYNIQQQGANP